MSSEISMSDSSESEVVFSFSDAFSSDQSETEVVFSYSDAYSSDEEDTGNGSSDQNNWIDARNPRRMQFRHGFTFSGDPGIKDQYIVLSSVFPYPSPGEFYSAFVDNEIIDMIVDQTNLYATQQLQSMDAKPQSRVHDWNPVSRIEIKKMLGIFLYMGIVKMPRFGDYWRSDAFYKNSFVPKLMSRNRFEIILRFLHFADNEEQVSDHEQKLRKIKPLTDRLIQKFTDVYEPGEFLTVDESFVPFKGRLSFKQYIKSKAHSYGIKIFKLCSHGGYTHNLMIYRGKTTPKISPEDIVTTLSQAYLDAGRTIISDNYYTSIPLARTLLQRKTHLVGTIRRNRRGLPHYVTHAKLKKREMLAQRNGEGITLLNWRDKRNVFLLSTRHALKMTAIKKKTRPPVVKPQSIVFYNKQKWAVDHTDQLASYNSPLRRGMKWYRKVALELLLNTSLLNARFIHHKITGNDMSMLDFRKAVIEYLVADNDSSADSISSTATRAASSGPSNNIPHKLLKLESNLPNYKRRRQCKACYRRLSHKYDRIFAQNRSKKVITYCSGCEGEPMYCVDCFNRDHNIRAKK